MINTLNMIYDSTKFDEALSTFPLEWRWNDGDENNCKGWSLCCGEYKVASIWNIDTSYQTYRTAWCGAHNIETDIEEAKRKCEAIAARFKEERNATT